MNGQTGRVRSRPFSLKFCMGWTRARLRLAALLPMWAGISPWAGLGPPVLGPMFSDAVGVVKGVEFHPFHRGLFPSMEFGGRIDILAFCPLIEIASRDEGKRVCRDERKPMLPDF